VDDVSHLISYAVARYTDKATTSATYWESFMLAREVPALDGFQSMERLVVNSLAHHSACS
jgi:hypothetical protein